LADNAALSAFSIENEQMHIRAYYRLFNWKIIDYPPFSIEQLNQFHNGMV